MKKSDFLSRRDYWQAVIKEQKASGQSQVEFCKSRGVGKSSFYNWSSRLKKEKVLNFIPVKVERAERARLIFQNGMVLEFADLPSPEWILQIMGHSA